ncbi:ABC transporter substrate-binding protein [Propioniciclava soli]|uniref:ABC transporter substrate-binding protein n=1 Tax=Propioniciclava soli TaxID=2775081 RepID=UPI001E51309D|nr:extracellular solute-binding protein [Propioniciclava soli]
MEHTVARAAGVLAAVAALAATSACAGTQATTTAPSPAAPGTTAVTGGEPVEIAYLHRLPDGEGMTKVAELAEQWNEENPDIQVTATKFDGRAAEMITKIEADVQAGTAPCLAQAGYAEVPSLFTRGLLADVTSEAAGYADNYSAGAFSLMTVGGTTVGLPQDGGPLVYYYNAAEFERLGLTVPTTMTELADVAKTAAGQGKYVVAFQPDEAQYWLAAQAAAAGGTWFSAENDAWRVDAAGEASQQVAGLWQDLLDSDAALVEQRWGDGFRGALNDQSLIGTIGAAWEAPLLAGDMAGTANEGQWSVAQLPSFGSEAMTGPDGGFGVVVLRTCDHPAEAMEFNNWLNTQIDALVSQGLVVAATGPMETPEAIRTFYGGQDVFAELATANENLNPDFPYIPTYPAIGAEMAAAADRAGSGQGTVMDIFTTAQEASVSSLEDAGLPVAR